MGEIHNNMEVLLLSESGISMVDHFAELEDPRIDRAKHHQLLDIIIIAVCGVICGADS